MESKTTNTHNFFAFASSQIQELVRVGRYGTSQSYTKSVASFWRFLLEDCHTSGPDCFSVEQLDEKLIQKYNHYLAARGVIRNSISFYNRTLRAIYNKAVRQYRIENKIPFSEVYTAVDRTSSRAISESSIAKLASLDLSANKPLEITRDLFLLSYALRGMSFVDMAYLTKHNLHGSRLLYFRKKTGTRMEVRLEPQAKRIMEKYTKKSSEYLLPLLQDVSGNSEQHIYQCYQTKLAVYNRNLKKLSSMIREKIPLTSYVSRHSWANVAYNMKVSISIISESLGHSTERTTRIYLGSLNSRSIDEANRKLQERLWKNVSYQETNDLQSYA